MGHSTRSRLVQALFALFRRALALGRAAWAWNSPKDLLIMSSIFISSTLSRFKIMLYVSLNLLCSLVADPVSSFLSSSSPGMSSQQATMTVPNLSSPLLPALPAIWVYSPESRVLKLWPSCFLREWKTTDLAGALTPMAKVSVEKRILTRPLQKSISTTSLTMGNSPEW